MNKLRLKRTLYSNKGVLGELYYNNVFVGYTYELPWDYNKRSISCIPEGEYEVKPYSSEKFPNVFQVCDVPSRTNILMHIGNDEEDTNGCILVGKEVGFLKSKQDAHQRNLAVLSSRNAFEELRVLVSYPCSIVIDND